MTFSIPLWTSTSFYNLDDYDILDTSLDLDLVLQPFSGACQTQLGELLAAARDGSVAKAGRFQPARAILDAMSFFAGPRCPGGSP